MKWKEIFAQILWTFKILKYVGKHDTRVGRLGGTFELVLTFFHWISFAEYHHLIDIEYYQRSCHLEKDTK